MYEDNLTASNPKTANHHWFPFLRYKRECEASGKEVSVNDWLRATGQLDEKIAHEESVALAAKIAAEKEAEAIKEIEKEALKKRRKYKVKPRKKQIKRIVRVSFDTQ
ncbi:hypothetical protein [Prochlorococcus marinus]|uniref:hypothetical protein n=1 Tax=Prochlorococcus marinus TaxID=1219 RepID=UPI0022B55A5C|nr:hypothetical protein [Prochlorococcus marinus]